MSLSYFTPKKFRRQSKQPDPANEAAVSTAVDAAVGKPTTEPTIASPPAPAVSTPSDEPAAEPVLDEEDERFLARLAELANEPEGPRPPLPTRPSAVVVENGESGEKKAVGRDAQEALMDGADKVPLPTSPPEVVVTDADKEKGTGKEGLGRRKSVMSYFALAQAKFKKATDKSSDPSSSKETKGKEKEKEKEKDKKKDKTAAADTLHSAATTFSQSEKAKEEQDLTAILDDLNLSAVNNRVFSFSAESEALFNRFKLILKDIISGAPTAYNDLEILFTDYETTLKNMYGGLPPFLQNMVKSLPAKMTAALGPEVLAATAEKPGFDAKQKQTWQEGAKSYAKKKAKQKARIPSLRSLLSAEGAVATMLRSILNFLKLRFPAIMTGTNVVMSLAVCLLLFVFWYCHKRGRETRLEKEEEDRLAADNPNSNSNVASSASSVASADDSIFASNANLRNANGESSRQAGNVDEVAQPPLVISDERDGQGRATVEDMPSVKDLPSPSAK